MTGTRKPSVPKRDALICRVTISIPLDLTDGKSYEKATAAIIGLGASLPPGTICDVASRGIGKIPAIVAPAAPAKDDMTPPTHLRRT